MLNIESFAKCIRDNLKDRRFGKERADEIIKEFEDRAANYTRQGRTEADASLLAMRETFDNMASTAAEKTKRTAKMLAVQAQNMKQVDLGAKVDVKAFTAKDFFGKQVGPRGSRGKAIAHAVKALVEQDPRFQNTSYTLLRKIVNDQFYTLFDDALQKVDIGAFGRQKGKAHLPNIEREIRGEHTGDEVAKQLADSWLKISDLAVDMFNAAGGSMRKLNRYFPQEHNSAKLLHPDNGGEAGYVKSHLEWVDWNKTRWPDGSPILPEDRAKVLAKIYDTKSSNGANKIDPTAFRGQGRALGNALDQHRFLHYKDSASWQAAHEKYGDGTVFDVMTRHIGDMAHRIAAIETFGPNPDLTFENLAAIARSKAQELKLTGKEKAELEGILNNKVKPMFDIVMRNNPMNPESTLAAAVNTSGNLTTAALLGSVTFASATGDLATTAVIRRFNKMPVMGGMKHYFDVIASDREGAKGIMARSGFIHEQSLSSLYATDRFNPLAAAGPHLSRKVTDVVLRSSGMVATTTAARSRAQFEFLGLMHDMKGKSFEQLPWNGVMKRYGITAEEWDLFRTKVQSWKPDEGVEFLRPLDILESDIPNKTQLFRKFQGMVQQESRYMVPDSTIESSVTLRGNTRPDTMVGALLYSFGMYKNFPLTFYTIYGRLGMTTEKAQGRLGFYAGMAAATTIAGAMAVQLNELKNGRDPLPMDDARFWGKAFMKGGGAGIWGDFLFSGINQFGQGPQDVAAGPLVGVVGDAMQIVLGDAFALATTDDIENYDSKTPERMVEFLRRYTPGSNLWWAQRAFQSAFWDSMENIADPKAYDKRRRKVANQKKIYGNDYYWQPGEATPDRAPRFGEE